MEAKEKAIELVRKFTPLVEYWDFHNNKIKIKEDIIANAKQCALIAVMEIINSNPHSNPFNTDVHSIMSFWQEVKIEIENL